MAQMRGRKLSKKEEKAAKKSPLSVKPAFRVSEPVVPAKSGKTVALPEIIPVKDFAERANLPVTYVISTLMKNGILATINQTIDYETAAIVGDDLGIVVEREVGQKAASHSFGDATSNENEADLVSRPPVVTIMGHVDHGKTTLLDRIRQANVAGGESGGITQHITAYQVTLSETKNDNLKGRLITFIDTPGHAAFSKMREHGTTITDIVVLIVAANDGVMPQTAEVIEKSQENNVPIIVAINKVDLPDADVMKVKQQLTEYNLVPEEWGGKTVMVEISAKTGQGVSDLLEMILLQADLADFRANPKSKAVGVVIESRLKKGSGSVPTVLIENGTLRVGEPIAIGPVLGKVRSLESFSGKKLTEAGPSTPVRISGLKSMPGFGDRLIAFNSDREAKEAAQKLERNQSTMHIATAHRLPGGEDISAEDKVEFRMIIKSDVVGSLEAVKKLLQEIGSTKIDIKIISEGAGAVTESDATLAQATKATIYGFRTQVLMAARKIAEKEGIEIKLYDVIYKLIDDIKVEAAKLLPPIVTEEENGRAKVLAIFRDDKKAFVSGGMVESGQFKVGDEVKVLQSDNVKYRAKLTTLRQGKNEVKECSSGKECGFGFAPGANIAVGDTIISYTTIKTAQMI